MSTGQQALITKFWKPTSTSNTDKPYFDFLFEKEEAERKKREEEEQRRIDEEEERIQREWEEEQRLRGEDRLRKREADRRKREEDYKMREQRQIRKGEGREILPGLFLGARLAAQNYEWLMDNVSYILNVTGEVGNYYEDETENFTYKRIPVEDSHETPLSKYFEETSAFIQQALDHYNATACDTDKPNQQLDEDLKLEEDKVTTTTADESNTDQQQKKPKGVLVHCREGLSRSPSIILAYLVGHGFLESGVVRKMKLQEAYEMVQTKNDGLRVNAGFLRQLMQLELQVHKENSVDFFDKKARRGASDKTTQSSNDTTPSDDKPQATTPRRRLRKVKNAEVAPQADDTTDPPVVEPDTKETEIQQQATVEDTKQSTESMTASSEPVVTDTKPADSDTPSVIANVVDVQNATSTTAQDKVESVQEQEKPTEMVDEESAQKKRKMDEENKENEGDTNTQHIEKKRKKKDNNGAPTTPKRNPGTPSKEKKVGQKNTLLNYFKV